METVNGSGSGMLELKCEELLFIYLFIYLSCKSSPAGLNYSRTQLREGGWGLIERRAHLRGGAYSILLLENGIDSP